MLTKSVKPNATVVLLFFSGDGAGVNATYVVKLLFAGQPRNRRVARSIDWTINDGSIADSHDTQDGFLVATLGDLVGQDVALFGRLPGIEGGQAL